MMKLARRRFLISWAALATAAAGCGAARAQYPSRPVHIVLGFPAGGSSDVIGRLMAQWLSQWLNQPFLFENRPGAGSNIGTEYVARAAPDGLTLLWATSANAINATLYENLSFDFMRDFTPVASVFRVPNVLEVHPSVPVKTVPELIAYARDNPGKLNFASGGIGATSHLAAELFKSLTGVDMRHVPYRGSAPALIDLLSGQVQLMFDLMPASIGYIRAGKLRPLAVTTGIRSEVLPDIPTVSEFLAGYEASTWNGVAVPKNTPAEIVGTLNRGINAGVADPTIMSRLADLGATALADSPSEARRLLAEETEKWGKLIRTLNIKAQ
ncbi:MAG TPA: tripartite tricarboxylate transporter substrate binding protein [Xanthobacteraceae bacterium]|jgi:tripartite-type tricarboxylate transporter receptor subunit TctC